MNLILVAVDGSDRARGVVDAATALAARTASEVLLLRAIEHPHRPGSLLRNEEAEMQQLEREADRALASLMEDVPMQLRRGTRVGFGVPWEVIGRIAELEDVDLVVIGAHGYRGLDRVLGTTAGKVVDHATRSVLVVRGPERISGHRPDGGRKAP